jgi:hypothetical protein
VSKLLINGILLKAGGLTLVCATLALPQRLTSVGELGVQLKTVAMESKLDANAALDKLKTLPGQDLAEFGLRNQSEVQKATLDTPIVTFVVPESTIRTLPSNSLDLLTGRIEIFYIVRIEKKRLFLLGLTKKSGHWILTRVGGAEFLPALPFRTDVERDFILQVPTVDAYLLGQIQVKDNTWLVKAALPNRFFPNADYIDPLRAFQSLANDLRLR